MKFQVVVQYSGCELSDFDYLVEVEDILTEKLGSDAIVDGHDMGVDQMNIFIFTDHPDACGKTIIDVLATMKNEKSFKLAYRKVDEEQFVIVWPPALNSFDVL